MNLVNFQLSTHVNKSLNEKSVSLKGTNKEIVFLNLLQSKVLTLRHLLRVPNKVRESHLGDGMDKAKENFINGLKNSLRVTWAY